MKVVEKYILPVAGLGTRFLPATKAIPKEMLPVVDKPLIQYAAEEAIEAGAKQLILVTHANKRALEDHFDYFPELESELEAKGKDVLLQKVRDILPNMVEVIVVRQAKPLGLGHAVLCARSVVGEEPFGVILPDVLVDNRPGCMAQLASQYAEKQNSIIGVEDVSIEDVHKYGIVSLVSNSEQRLQQMVGVVEKPLPKETPSTLSMVGRYILTPRIMKMLERTKPGAGGEIQLTDGISALINEEPVYAYSFDGKSYDCGHKLGFVQANAEYALKDPEIGRAFEKSLREQLL
jgi:UTP--glucose-1-phosphate uridylyltransferase